ncbi:hypothetical protein Pedsa_3248 [Pseudopedobacter saltans DSM 12145]|uniref:Uncharacterized protein n=1 Tax=Pseudopedobacter saltans (strain ATCC 51119 / DSM 12145 / JCM 21818 / CCUG 39354 / LMG 10337 / NBRC 100064 / NCIMB 13643) TaxID=762903 RepID=F0SBU2_PSESL|nr:CHAP domain-containing protein [Pseudopedobacter saltans]ADY53783.1 hypothetical protein Pedsa_3248 [Pseudopedobacter saltans DSM 12145]
MAKSNYLSVFLSVFIIWLCLYFYGGDIVSKGDPIVSQLSDHEYNSLLTIRTSNTENSKRVLLRQIYLAELGVRELSNRNDGERVETYLAYTGNKKGDAWCASFVCWVLGKAGVVNPRSAWSPALFLKDRVIWQPKNKRVAPQKGDVFAIWFVDKGRIAHCGFVDEWNDKLVVTVEGNTNEAGSRDGDGVYRKRRLINSIFAVANWVDRKEVLHGL